MTDEGKQITESIRGLRNLFAEISLLIQTLDTEMPKRGWERTTKYDIVWSGLSQTVWQHQKWMPSDFFRFFECKAFPDSLTCISIILDSVDDREVVEKPLISAAIFEYGPERDPNNWDYWYSRIHLYMPDRMDDGSRIEVTGRELSEISQNGELEKISTFALPLISITNAEELANRILSPLTLYFKNQPAAPSAPG